MLNKNHFFQNLDWSYGFNKTIIVRCIKNSNSGKNNYRSVKNTSGQLDLNLKFKVLKLNLKLTEIIECYIKHNSNNSNLELEGN